VVVPLLVGHKHPIGRIGERVAQHGHPGTVGGDAGPGLARKDAITQVERPIGDGFAGENAELAAKEAAALYLIADHLDRCPAVRQVKVNVLDGAELRNAESTGDQSGVRSAHPKVDVANAAEKSRVLGIAQLLAGAGLVHSEMEDVLGIWPLEAGRVVCHGEHRASDPKTNQTDAAPQLHRARKAIAAFRNEDDAALHLCFQLVDGCLQGGGVVALAAGVGAELPGGEHIGLGVTRLNGENRFAMLHRSASFLIHSRPGGWPMAV